MRKPSLAAIVSLVMLAVGGLTACSAEPSGAEGQLGHDVMNQEYRQTVASFPFALPDGIAFPADVKEESDDEFTYLYPPGYGEMQAYMFAEQAWVCAALADNPSAPEAAVAALASAQEIHESPVLTDRIVDPEKFWQAMVAKAKLGDYAELAEFYAGAC